MEKTLIITDLHGAKHSLPLDTINGFTVDFWHDPEGEPLTMVTVEHDEGNVECLNNPVSIVRAYADLCTKSVQSIELPTRQIAAGNMYLTLHGRDRYATYWNEVDLIHVLHDPQEGLKTRPPRSHKYTVMDATTEPGSVLMMTAHKAIKVIPKNDRTTEIRHIDGGDAINSHVKEHPFTVLERLIELHTG